VPVREAGTAPSSPPGQTEGVLVLRPARPEDAAAVAAVHVRSWQAGYRGLIPAAVLDDLRPEERAARYRFGEDDASAPATVVALDDGAIVGFATTGPREDPACGELLALYVDPDAWDRGIGRRLLAGARVALARTGSERGLVWVLAGNARAERFYRADGWEHDGTRRHAEVWGVAVEELCYRRPHLGDGLGARP